MERLLKASTVKKGGITSDVTLAGDLGRTEFTRKRRRLAEITNGSLATAAITSMCYHSARCLVWFNRAFFALICGGLLVSGVEVGDYGTRCCTDFLQR